MLGVPTPRPLSAFRGLIERAAGRLRRQAFSDVFCIQVLRYGVPRPLAIPAPVGEAQTPTGSRKLTNVQQETRFELAFVSRSSTSHSRYSLIARSSPSRWQRVAIVEFIDVYDVYRA